MTISLLIAIFFAATAMPDALNQSPIQSHTAQHTPAPHKNAASPAKRPAMPFRTGEVLNYRVSWATFSNAASVQLSALEQRNLYGWPTWHFRAAIHTVNSVRTLFTIDDQFDSYTDLGSLESHQYETYLNELGRQRDQIIHLVALGQPPRTPGAATVVLPGTRDPVGAFFTLRGVDWDQTKEVRTPLYDGRDVYQMVANREAGAENITASGKTFVASRIGIRLLQNGKENTSMHFVIWLENKPSRIPVVIQALLPFGSVRAELTSTSL
jgi:hypothetical protein